MGGIIATEHISVDGVVEAPGRGDIGAHPHKGWVTDSTILRGDLLTEVTRLARAAARPVP